MILLIMAGALSAGQPKLPHTRHNPVVIAHRADHTRMPENTIAAIEDAIRHDLDYVEIDLRTSRDGALVLSHDASLKRMTGTPGNIRDLTLDEIKRLAIHGPDSIHHIPAFGEVLEHCKKKINIYLDFKEADVAETWRQIRAMKMEHQIVVYCNNMEQYIRWRTVAPSMPLMTSLPDEIKTSAATAAWLDAHPVNVLDNVSDTAIMDVVRKRGIAVWLDVEDDNEGPIEWQKALDKNVQGLQSDHPEALRAWLSSVSRPSRAAPPHAEGTTPSHR